MSLLHEGSRDDLIPADAVDDLLRTVRVGIDKLDVELKRARLEIVQLEVELAAHADDVRPGDEGLEVAHSAIEGVAVGAQEHLATVVAAARAHADARIAAAQAEAAWVVQAAREEVARSLVAPLGLGDPVPPTVAIPAAPALPPVAELARWGPPATSPVEQATAPPAAPSAANSTPAPLPPAAQPTRVSAPASAEPSAVPVTELAPESPAERAFWGHDGEPSEPRRGGVDLLLTAVSALLVLAILAILLAWIG